MSIDWYQQWALFSENFYNGKSHLDLSIYQPLCQKLLVMEPGPGFGDHSHPTTRLMLEMMADRVAGRNVVDVGSGSGVLSFAAAYFGAKEVVGLDIDPKAVWHARKNALLNPDAKVKFFRSLKKVPHQPLFLMNMITSEQKQVMQNPLFLKHSKEWILSGVLKEELAAYQDQLELWGLVIKTTYFKEGWAGIICSS